MVEREDRGPRTHSTVVERRSREHSNRSFKVYLTKTSHIITRTYHVKQAPISTESSTYMAQKPMLHDGDFDRVVNNYSVAYPGTYCTETHVERHIENKTDKS